MPFRTCYKPRRAASRLGCRRWPRDVTIVDYRETWPGEFRELAAGLRAALGDRALRIDHIGSTAVPGLAAKDVIDVQVTVADLAAAPAAIAGFEARGVHGDHPPPGFAGDPGGAREAVLPACGRRRATPTSTSARPAA